MENAEVTGVGLVARLRSSADAPGAWACALMREAADALEAADRQLLSLRRLADTYKAERDAEEARGAELVRERDQLAEQLQAAQEQLEALRRERDQLAEARSGERGGGAFVRALIPVRVWHDGFWRVAEIDSYDLERMRRAVTERARAGRPGELP